MTKSIAEDTSVIIPAYNAEQTVADTIQSVLDQTRGPLEVIVVNDGSKDGTEEVVASFGERVTLINQENAGVSAARNHGTSKASGNWVAYLDSDDTWYPEKLEKQSDYLESNPKLAWCATRFFRCSGDNKTLSNDKDNTGSASNTNRIIDAFESLSGRTSAWIGTIIVRKELVDRVGGFCTELASPADNDLWIRIAIEEPKLGFIDTPLVDYLIYPESMSGQSSRKIKPERFVFYKRLAALIDDAPEEHREGCIKFYDRSVGIYLFNLARAGNVDLSRELMAWLKDNKMRIPSWKFRWPMWLPSGLIQMTRTTWRSWKSRKA